MNYCVRLENKRKIPHLLEKKIHTENKQQGYTMKYRVE